MRILIIGAGGFAKEIIDLVKENTKGQIVGFVGPQVIKELFVYERLGEDKDIDKIIKKYKVSHFFVAIGDVKTRASIYAYLKVKVTPLSIISKAAYISRFSKIGNHAVIYPGVVINADVQIGDNVVINSNVSLGHEVKVSNNVNMNPGANIAGKVIIKDFATIGIGATIRENIVIETNCLIGAGSVVVKNTRKNKVYAGVPAKVLRENEN